MAFIETGVGRIGVAELGAGPPLVLLHANPGDRRDWEAVTPALARRHRVLALDWPGYGESPAPADPSTATAFLFARALREVVERLALPPAILVGSSVGGFAATSLALEHPDRVRALVLVDSGGFTRHTPVTRGFTRLKGRAWVTRLIAGRFARHYLRRRTPVATAMIARAEAERRLPARVAVDAAVWRSFLDPRHDLRARAATLSLPVLLVWGRHDPVLPPHRDGAEAQRALPHAKLVVLDTGHAAYAEDPAAFLAAVEPFLAALDGQAAGGALAGTR